ncbi:DnaT-like ssDNA-binding domain-containing protein [Ectopseudomonas alcaliphila]|uniref:DnaT-like ssDNA-binding domain-containing protein n=1 Tax=Ectopseudomonas alcaliphila TaxID=101564 RepID=A0ABU4Q875_9GAMM|nr:DnaT-like ssDNA-binding domain-containing protein [Pseudomonas alcaliphila]MDX5990455.1 DnaT-like ssDNA-binding domain-containing protein [Pseudomonas alcaliphila]MDX5995425.1 DnaT-like ssDNA-binding domain-containing protein [Pseudomonas alcaliphila]MDX5995470.1 DnaT-like ssDNA-binding domain-containing protein [Pseudomonas alcaliphila]
MVAIRIDDAEWELLAGEPAELTKLYIAIKRRMDFATGIAGHKTLLSEIVLREGFTVDPIPGRPKPKPITREMYRSAVRRLEKLGLLVTIGTMVYQFPHARSDASPKTATTELQPAAQPQQQPTGDRLQPSEYAASSEIEGEQQPEQQPYSSPINNLLPESGDPMMVLQRARQFPMPLEGWSPIAKSFKAIAFKNAVPLSALTTERLNAFCSYWHVRPEKEQTQAQWEYQLVDHLKKQIQFAANSEAKPYGQSRSEEAAARRGSGKRSLSAVEQVEAAIAEQRAELAKPSGAAIADSDGEALENDGGDLRPPLDGEFWREAEA